MLHGHGQERGRLSAGMTPSRNLQDGKEPAMPRAGEGVGECSGLRAQHVFWRRKEEQKRGLEFEGAVDVCGV